MINEKKIIAIIPARGGSKSIPQKNIKLLAGKSLIYYTINEAKKSKYIDRAIVSTDNEEIAEVAKKYEVEVIDRPKELAQDDTPMPPVLQHVVKHLKEAENYDADIILCLSPTTPFRTVQDIDLAIEKMLKTNADSVVSFCLAENPPAWMFRVEGDKAIPFDKENLPKRRQDLPRIYKLNGAIYVIRRNVLMEDGKIYGKDIRALIMSSEKSIDIDTMMDFKLAELLIKEKNEKHKNWKF